MSYPLPLQNHQTYSKTILNKKSNIDTVFFTKTYVLKTSTRK